MMEFGWKKKAERLRMVILSGAHQLAKELPQGILRVLVLFERAHKTKDASLLMEEFEDSAIDAHAQAISQEEKPLWEPLNIYGWEIKATLYLQNKQLWWLVHAVRIDEKSPSTKDVAFLEKILAHLGADPQRDAIIGPGSGPANESGLIPFGWWTWFNRHPLYEIQVNKTKPKEMIRVVPLGTPESGGYQSIPKPGNR